MGFIDVNIKPTSIAMIVIGIILVLLVVGNGLNFISDLFNFGSHEVGNQYIAVAWILIIIFVILGIYKVFFERPSY